MKKILATVLSLALASSISLALVACGGDGDGDDKTSGGTATIVSEKVTKGQWESAFTANNFTNGAVKVVQTMKGDIRIGNGVTAKGTVTTTKDVVIDGDKQYMKTSYSAKGEKALTDYAATMEDREQYTKAYDISVPDYPLYIYYGKKGPHWDNFSDKEQDGRVHWQILYNWDSEGLFDSEIEYILELGQWYDAFEYNNAKKGYTAKEEANEQLKGFVLKFKDYKLIAMETDENDEGDVTYQQTYTITYGNQTVSLPTMTGTTNFDGTWKTSHIYNSLLENTYNIGDTVEYYLGNNPVELAADTFTITFKNDGTATYKYVNVSNPCIWDYSTDRVLLYSNNLPEDARQWYLSYDATSGYLSMRLGGSPNINIYLEKEAQ